jgi:YVTN family beta-propeller protein
LKKVCLVAFLFCLTLAGCQTTGPLVKVPLEAEGEVLLYLQPFPQEADRLRFEIERISATRADGTEARFFVNLRTFRGREMTRQRLLGVARLPEGTYTGLSITISNAFLKVEDGEATLLVPATSVRIDFPFTVYRKKGLVLALIFKVAESVTGGYAFTPVFSVFVPPKPLTDLTGFVTSYQGNNVLVFDKKAGQVTGLITTDGAAGGMVLDRRRGKVYVALPDADTIDAIDLLSGEAMGKIVLHSGDRPIEIALTPDGKMLVSANSRSNSVSIIDTGSLLETGRVVVGNGPGAVLMDPTGRRAYIFNRLSSTISVIDIPGRALLATVATDPGPLRGQFSRRGDRFYVIHEWSAYVSVIESASLSVVKRMQVGSGIVSIKIDPITDLVYLGRRNDPKVGIYEPISFVPVDYVQTGGGAVYLAIDNDSNNLIIVEGDTRRLLIVNLISKKVLATMDVGEAPYWASVAGER